MTNTSYNEQPSALDLAQARFERAILGCVGELERIILPTLQQRTQDAFRVLLAADSQWYSELVNVFGANVEAMRYTDAGRALPGYSVLNAAGADWHALVDLTYGGAK